MAVNIFANVESKSKRKYSLLDFAFSVIGIGTFLCDVGTDLWVASQFCVRGNLLWFGVWISVMIATSIVVHIFSWLWIQYDRKPKDYKRKTSAENVLLGSKRRLRVSPLLHFFQLGLLSRQVSAVWKGFHVLRNGKQSSDYVIYMTHDISMLRLIDTFCEGVPQLTMMIYILLRNNQASFFQCVSAAVSLLSIAWMVVDYHRSLRSFLPDKAEQNWGSSAVYFLWNFLLIGQRVCSLALFACALPFYLALHFLLLWPVLALWAHLQKTAFMESCGGEHLYRAVVGLVWYFSWFNVAQGRTRGRAVVYHVFLAVDGAILVTTWWCYRDVGETQHYAVWLVLVLVIAQLLGVLLKVLYYSCFHPTLPLSPAAGPGEDQPDDQVTFKAFATQPEPPLPQLWQNKRMACQASCFFDA